MFLIFVYIVDYAWLYLIFIIISVNIYVIVYVIFYVILFYDIIIINVCLYETVIKL